jgi:hypothetical protein
MSLPAVRETTDLDVPSKTAVRLAGAGFVGAGLFTLIAIGLQVAIGRGVVGIPSVVFQVIHVLSGPALAVAAGLGFVFGRPRVARYLSAMTVVAVAAWTSWGRLGLPAFDWTIPRILFGIVLVVGGVRLIGMTPRIGPPTVDP